MIRIREIGRGASQAVILLNRYVDRFVKNKEGRLVTEKQPEELKAPYRIDYTQCCGTLEVHGISHERTPIDILRGILTAYQGAFSAEQHKSRAISTLHSTPAHNLLWAAQVIFNQAYRPGYGDPRYGEILADYITQQRLGPVVASAPAPNPNTGNIITTFVWTPDHNALAKWVEEQDNNNSQAVVERRR